MPPEVSTYWNDIVSKISALTTQARQLHFVYLGAVSFFLLSSAVVSDLDVFLDGSVQLPVLSINASLDIFMLAGPFLLFPLSIYFYYVLDELGASRRLFLESGEHGMSRNKLAAWVVLDRIIHDAVLLRPEQDENGNPVGTQEEDEWANMGRWKKQWKRLVRSMRILVGEMALWNFLPIALTLNTIALTRTHYTYTLSLHIAVNLFAVYMAYRFRWRFYDDKRFRKVRNCKKLLAISFLALAPLVVILPTRFDGPEWAGTRFLDLNIDFSDIKKANSNLKRDKVILEDRNFDHAMLDHLDLRGATIRRVVFDWASMKVVDFSGAYLEDCSFIGSDLTGVILDSATVKDCNFSSANMTESNFDRARVELSDFSQTILESAILDSVVTFPIEDMAKARTLYGASLSDETKYLIRTGRGDTLFWGPTSSNAF